MEKFKIKYLYNILKLLEESPRTRKYVAKKLNIADTNMNIKVAKLLNTGLVEEIVTRNIRKTRAKPYVIIQGKKYETLNILRKHPRFLVLTKEGKKVLFDIDNVKYIFEYIV
jgi:predicted transcriptional regulator